MRWAWLAAVVVYGDTYPRQPNVDAEHYAFCIQLSDLTDEIRGETQVDFRITGTAEITLDFASTMMVDRVSSGTAPLAFEHRGDRLRISLPSTAERQSVRVRYHGKPAGGLRIGPNLYGDRTFFSANWPDGARQWLPMIDHPYDKATSEFYVTAPSRYQVVANGLPQEEIDLRDGRRKTHWKQSVPVASWLNAIAVAQFSVRHFGTVKGIALSNWVYPQDREKGIETFDIPTRNAVEFFSDFAGPYPYEKLANVEAAGLSGGMEHASVIFYGEKSVTMKPATNLVAHEIAHQWFGNSVTESDWDDVWLSEGFATYFTLLCKEHVEGRDAFVNGLKLSQVAVIGSDQKLPDTPVIHQNLADMKKVVNRLVYEKGAWTLHMLRGLMGVETFRAGIRDYYQQYRGRNATTADFQRIMEQHSGMPLGWFFDQWLRRPGLPEMEGAWSYDTSRQQVRITIRQKQAGAVYRLPLEFGLDEDRIERVEMNTREAEFVFAAPKEPAAVRLDPNTWLLAAGTFKKQ